MYRSYTSSSEPRTRAFAWSTIWRFPALVVAALLVTELLLHVDAVQHLLPPATQYYQPAVPRRLDALHHVLAQGHGVDVLFIGSSIVRTNLSPIEFDGVIRQRLGIDLVSFNGGLSGLWPAAVQMYLRELWLGRVRPKVVMQGVRFPELRATTFAQDDDVLTSPVESRWRRGGTLNRLETRILDDVHLLHYRGVIGRWLRRYTSGRPGDDEDTRWAIDSRGFTHRGPPLPETLASGRLRHERPHTGDVAVERDRFGFEAIRRAAELCRRSGVRYVLVNVPEFAFRWSAPDGQQRYTNYLREVERFAGVNGFEFIDVTDGRADAFSDPTEYSDYHHMSPKGAQRFTRLLATHLVEHDGTWLRELAPAVLEPAQRAAGRTQDRP